MVETLIHSQEKQAQQKPKHEDGLVPLGMYDYLVADQGGIPVYGVLERVDCDSPNNCRITLQNGEGPISGVIFGGNDTQNQLEAGIGETVLGRSLRGEVLGIKIPDMSSDSPVEDQETQEIAAD